MGSAFPSPALMVGNANWNPKLCPNVLALASLIIFSRLLRWPLS